MDTQREHLLLEAINALMLERRALRSYAAAIAMPNAVPRAQRTELMHLFMHSEGGARRACREAGIELRNNDQPHEVPK